MLPMLNKFSVMIPIGLHYFMDMNTIVCYITSYGTIWGLIMESKICVTASYVDMFRKFLWLHF